MKQDGDVQEGPLPRSREAVDWWLKQWGRGEALSGDEPMTREDVEGLIRANGGTAAGLDLAGRNLREADLSEMNLREVHMQGADLGHADLREADLFRAGLQEADLFRVDLRGAFLMQAGVQGAYLLAVRMDDQTNLDYVNWGHKYINEWERSRLYRNAQASYRQLNIWHKNHGHADIAGEFLIREWVCKRKEALERIGDRLSWRHPWRTLQALNWEWWRALIFFCWLAGHELLFGYGERPIRVVATAIFVVLGFGLVYFILTPVDYFSEAEGGLWGHFVYACYFSLVSFTTLGYGEWVQRHPVTWLSYLGGIQSFIGLFITALFLVTFTRKWTR